MLAPSWLLLLTVSPGVIMLAACVLGILFDLIDDLRTPERYRFLCIPLPPDNHRATAELFRVIEAKIEASVTQYGEDHFTTTYLRLIQAAKSDGGIGTGEAYKRLLRLRRQLRQLAIDRHRLAKH